VRGAKSYSRRGPVREPYDSVLIVCEGGKTEPNYLHGLRITYGLSSANIKITPADGTDPMSIVAFAEAESAQDTYDRVFCVFDRDGHSNYEAALQRVAQLPRFTPVTSWPCFEIWVLLHYRFSSAPFNTSGKESACDRVVREVRKHFPAYAKGHKAVFDELVPRLDGAMRHARMLQAHNLRSGSTNPSTRVHELVDYLIRLKA